MKKNNLFLKENLPSSLVVFLVALPLCLGVGLASTSVPGINGLPNIFSGIIAGIIGGVVVGTLSGSRIGVSGPAAGLITIILGALATLGSFEAFLLAVIIGGIIQVIAGFLNLGILANYFPSAVIKGMLAAIGITLILKEIPHLVGYDADFFGDESFVQPDGHNTFSEIIYAFGSLQLGSIVIGALSLGLLILFDRPFMKKVQLFKLLPGALFVVTLAIGMNGLFQFILPALAISSEHLVQLPVVKSFNEFSAILSFPDFNFLSDPNVYIVGGTLALVGSLETLLSVEATDKLDPEKHHTPTNLELKAQGIGNILSGLVGGLPITQVIVRSSANVNSGAKSKLSTIFHGIWLLLAVVFLAPLLNKIPLAALAAILIMVGYKLSNAGLYKQQYKLGYEQFIPFMVTIIGVLLTDLLKGIAVGMGVAIFFILRKNYKNNYTIKRHEYAGNDIVVMELSEELTYLNKASINETLQKLKENTKLVIDGSRCKSIDYDALEIIENFVRYDAIEKKITVELIDIKLASISNIVSPISHSNPEKNMETFYNQLLENNKKWVDRHMERDPEFFQRLSKGQNPPLLWIGCADSRVPANEIIGAQPGEVFVHRNIANMVVHSDMNMLSVLDYAVNVLKVKHVIVCGHYGCGGVQAAMTNKHIGLIDNWIRHIKDTYRFHQQELNAIEDEKQRFDRFVELNVVEQVYDLAKTSIVQSAWENGQDLHIHGWVYDVADGLINDLKITLKNNEQLSEVYQLDL